MITCPAESLAKGRLLEVLAQSIRRKKKKSFYLGFGLQSCCWLSLGNCFYYYHHLIFFFFLPSSSSLTSRHLYISACVCLCHCLCLSVPSSLSLFCFFSGSTLVHQGLELAQHRILWRLRAKRASLLPFHCIRRHRPRLNTIEHDDFHFALIGSFPDHLSSNILRQTAILLSSWRTDTNLCVHGLH